MAKLIDREINSTLDLEGAKRLLCARYDYSLADCYNQIDSLGSKQLEHADLSRFFRRNGLVTYDDEISQMIRRLDFDSDGLVSFSDFLRVLRSVEGVQGSPSRSVYRSPLKSSTHLSRYATPSRSPLRGADLTHSAARYSPIRNSIARSVNESYRQELTNSIRRQARSAYKEELNNSLRRERLASSLARSR